ncbi:PAS domain S-box protein [Sphaerospermopsis aphanizomenoides BCCUSP55]|uniref:PAS domain-containing protein n=1 Tax=Sphaerospermopsis aphanizomenoides TaxID=459663 RepID=UPI00190614B4|nr:PAS domain-containing protein [Sphaerospermopsis aphanizomenoides]MBK1990673.1 PAS domain S-box protein [Sphaerospermopsis aphanizomenoides BCCUSP55]
MRQKQSTVLIIEDSPEDRELYRRYLLRDSEYSYTILEAKQGKQGLELWQQQQPDVVLLDYRLPDMDGLEFLKKLRLQFTNVQIPIIILTGQGDEAIAVQSLKNGAQDYLVKGKLTVPKLCQAIHSALEKNQLIKQLRMQQQQQQILAAISLRIRQFFRLDEILQTTVQEVRELLIADRVIVYQFHRDMSGEIVAESVLPQWTPTLNCQIEDTCFRENKGIAYRHGKILAITDIYHAGLTDCHIQLLEKFEVKANLVVPILLNQELNDQQNSSQELWGLLIAHQCNNTREWQPTEIDLLQQLSVQIAVAIKQAELYENLQKLNASLETKVEERTQELEASERKFRAIFNQSFQFTALLTTEGILLEANQTSLISGGLKLEDVINKPFWEVYCWTISSATQEQLKQAIARAAQGEFIRYEVDILCIENQIITIDFSIRPLKDKFGKVILLIPEGRDITERKQAETTLKIQAQILNEIHDAVISTDINGIIQTWNHAAQTIYGYTATEVIGQHIGLLYISEELPKISELVFQPLLKYGNHEIELPNRTKSGKEIYISLRLSVMRDEQGNIIRLIGCSNDITKRKQAERALQQLNQELENRVERRTAALRESEQRFANLAAAAPVAIFRFDLDGNCVYVNDYWSKMMGRKAELALGQGWLETLHPDDRERLHQEYQQALQTTFTRGETYQNEARSVKPDGSIIWFYCQAVAETDSNGNIIGQIGTLTDITTRKNAEIALRESEEFNRSIFENNADCLKVLDTDGKIISMNQPGMVLMEVDDFDQVYGQEWVTFWPEPYQSAAIQSVETAKSGNVGRFQGFCPTAKGTPKWWDVLVAVVPDSEGKPLRLIATSRDITVNKQAEKQLQNLSDRLQLAIKSAQLGIWDYDFISNSLVWDDRMYEIFGVSPQNFDSTEEAYEKFVQLIHPDDRVTFYANFQQAIELNQELDIEFRIIWPNGSIHIIKGYGIIQRNSQGQPQRMIGINFDITERRQEEIENQQLKERLEFVLSASPAVIYTCQASDNFDATFLSSNVEKILGYTTEEWLAQPNFWLSHIHPEDLSLVVAQLSHLDDLEYHLHQYRFLHKNGNYLWIEDKFHLVRDQAGKPVEIIGYIADITEKQAALQERELAQLALRESEERLILALEASGDGLWDWNIITNELYLSPQWVEMLGFEVGELPSHVSTWEKLIHPEDQPYVQQKLNAHLQDASCDYRLNYRFQTKAGSYKWIANYGKAVVRDAQGNPLRMTGTHRDITETKNVESQLRQTNERLAISNEELARATRLKDEFLSNMSHELRTPLNAILGISEALQDEAFGVINEKQKRGVQTIERSGKHLLELINDILDLSKIEAGQMKCDYALIGISPLCQSSLSFIKQQAFQKRIQLDLKIEPNLPNLLIDERRIRQVLINLLNNAVKFTPEGGRITLEVTHTPPELTAEITSWPDFIRIAVIDTGIGIPSENLNKLFQPFIQIDSSLNRKYEGTGLGLALVKRFVEMHGGKVGVTSEIGVGSCFTVDLPCANISASAANVVNVESSPQNSTPISIVENSPLILLAEDHEANIFTISGYLESIGYRLILARNGQEAISLTKAEVPDLILMDIQMPEVDGLEAIKQIRLDANLTHIPIIALTALAMPGDQEKCLQAGANDYLSKPVKLKQLATIIQQILA